MSELRTSALTSLTLIVSETLVRADGRAAIRLKTFERGSVTFEVNLHAITTIRQALTVAKQHIRQGQSLN